MMPYDQRVAQAGHDSGAIFESFSAPAVGARCRHVLHPDRICAETYRSRFESQTRARAGLEEQKRDSLSGAAGVWPVTELERLCRLAKPIDIVAVDGGGAQQMIEVLRTSGAEIA